MPRIPDRFERRPELVPADAPRVLAPPFVFKMMRRTQDVDEQRAQIAAYRGECAICGATLVRESVHFSGKYFIDAHAFLTCPRSPAPGHRRWLAAALALVDSIRDANEIPTLSGQHRHASSPPRLHFRPQGDREYQFRDGWMALQAWWIRRTSAPLPHDVVRALDEAFDRTGSWSERFGPFVRLAIEALRAVDPADLHLPEASLTPDDGSPGDRPE